MPKGTRCPFSITLPKEDEFSEENRFLSFKQSIDPANPDGTKLTHKAKVCESSFVEDIL